MIVFLFVQNLMAQNINTEVLGQTVSNSDNALSIWVNPANMIFRSTPARDIYTFSNGKNKNFSYATSAGSLGFGLQYKSFDGQTYWSTNTALSMKLDEHLNLGFSYQWHAPVEMDNFSTFSIGMGWRPFSWLGFGGKIDNIGAPLKSLNIDQLAYFGSTLNMLNGKFQLSTQIQTPSDLTFESVDFIHQAQIKLGHFQFEVFQTPQVQVGVGLSYLFGQEIIHIQGTDEGSYALHMSKSPRQKHLAHQKPIAYIKLSSSYPYSSAPSTLFSSSSEPTYFQLISLLKQVANDNSMDGIFVHIEDMPFSTAQIQEIQSLILMAKSKGKMVITYLDESTNSKSYLLATASDRIFMHPAADLNIQGLSSERIFLKDTLEWVGIKPQYVKRSEYKSAPEQYTETHSTESAEQQTRELLESIYEHMVTTISKSRIIPKESIEEMIKNGPHSAIEAEAKGLVDGLYYHDEMKEKLEDIFGKKAELMKAKIHPHYSDGWGRESSIAIIPITGAIMSGTSQSSGLLSSSTAGSETIVAQLTEARKNDSIKSVVLRVDSPGGSAFASDEIWRAVEILKEEGKPVITSMGGVAASGGYYVASNSSKIFAEETTVTGSIGVYSGKFSTSELMSKLHIHTQRMNIGTDGSLYSTIYPWSETQEEKMEQMVEDTYVRFKDRVAKGRSLNEEQVESVARGRVWSGVKAKENGLVDEFGSLYDAIAEAESLVDGKDMNLVILRGGSSQQKPTIVPIQTLAEQNILMDIDPRFLDNDDSTVEQLRFVETNRIKIPVPSVNTQLPYSESTTMIEQIQRDLQFVEHLQMEQIWMIEPSLIGLDLK